MTMIYFVSVMGSEIFYNLSSLPVQQQSDRATIYRHCNIFKMNFGSNLNIASKLAAVCSVFIPTVSIKYLIKIRRKEENICCINTVLMHQHPSEVLMADWNQSPEMIGTSNNNSLFYSSISWFCPTYPLTILSVTDTRQNITRPAPLQVHTH